MTMVHGDKTARIGDLKARTLVQVAAAPAGAASASPGGDYLTRLLADALYAPVDHSHAWATITSKPTTLAGYGITDAQPASAELTAIAGLSSPGYVKRTGPGAYYVVASIPQADVVGGPFLPLAAGAANPLTGTLHGTSLNFTGWTSDAPISVSMNYSNAYAHAITVANPSLTAGQRLTVDFGQAASTNNQANFGFSYAGPGSTANKITLGLYGNNDLVAIAGTGVVTVRDLGTGFVRASSGALSASALVAADIPALDASKITTGAFADARIASAATWNAKLGTVTADSTSRAANTFYAAPNGAAGAATFRAIVAADVPTLNQNTTGSAAKWTTPRTLTIGATGKAVDGSANVSWSLAEIGAFALAGGTLNSGAQIATNKDITPSTSSNMNYALAPIVAQRASNSGTTTVAAVGFHNVGVNAAALYYDAATSVFRYNRHTGNIVTIWDASNLTNLNQLTNGPGYITSTGSISGNAATATKWATARTLTIGATGKTIDGTGNQSWSLAEIGAQAAGNYLPLSAGSGYPLSGRLWLADNVGSFVTGGRNSAGDPYFYVTATNATTAGVRLMTSNGGTGFVALSAEADGTIKLPILGAGFVRSAYGGALSSSALVAGDIPALPYLPVNNPTFTGILNGPVVDITGAGSGTVGAGPYVGTRSGSSAGWLFQLGASNTWDLWNLSSSTWTKQGYFLPGGNLVMNGAVTVGNAAMATWAPAAGYAWFGANNQNQNTSGNSGFLQQNSSGHIYMCAPSGTQAEIQVNGATILSASSTGVTLSKALYLNDNVGAYIVGGRNTTGDPYFYVTSTGTPTAGIRLLTNNAGTGIVALSAAANGAITLASSLAWGGGGAIGSSANVVQGENSTRTFHTHAWTSALPSGFYQSDSAGTTPSGGWCHMIAGRHADTGTNYQSQIATDFWNDRVWFRRIENGSVKSWREFWHSGSMAITAGAAHMGSWVDGTYARFGHTSWNAASGFGYLQQSNGTVFVEAPAGQSVNLRVNGTYIASAESGGYFWTKELVSAGPISLYNGSQPMARFSAEYNPYVGFSNSYDLILYNWPGSTFAEAMRLRGYDNSAWFYGMVAPAYGYAQNLGNAGNRWNNLYVDGIQLGDSCQLTNNGTSVLEISQTTELPVPTPGKMLFAYASAVPTNTYLQAPAGYALIYSVGASIESAAAMPFNGRACIAIGVARYNQSNAWFIIT